MAQQRVFKTRWGWMGLSATPQGIERLVLPRPSRREVESELMEYGSSQNGRSGSGRNVNQVITTARQQMLGFLSGERRELSFPIDLSEGSAFQRRVWKTAQRIPFGRVRSYGWIADRVGGKQYARAVGLALGANPVPVVVPCHRVVGHDGALCGFRGGLRLKRLLLDLEGTLSQLRRKV